MSWLDKLEKAPDDPILGITLAFNSDPNKDKINLGVGAYRDDKGKPYILPVIHKATEILNKTLGDKHNKEYLPIEGLAQFNELTAKVLFGEDSKHLKEKKIATAQSLSGTGALRLAAEFIKHNGDNKEIWVSNPTWGNHHNIFKHASLTVKEYRYYDEKTRGLDFKGLLEDLDKASQGATIVLHACAHNPTGVDPTFEQWKEIASLIQKKKLFTIFDIAYQGYASGDLENDARALRYFVSLDMPMIVCQSYAKNFGLYGERIGSISLVCSSQNAAESALSRLKLIIRTIYSSPQKHGAYLVATVLSDQNLYKEWIEELKKMSGRILELRKKLYDLLTNVYKTPGDWSHIVKQIGMFTYTGLNPKQVNELKDKFHIYLHSSGRISMAGLNSGNIEVFAKAVHQVVSNPSNL